MEAKAEDVTAGPGTRYEHVHSGGSKCIHRQERKPSAGRSGLQEGLRRPHGSGILEGGFRGIGALEEREALSRSGTCLCEAPRPRGA